MAISIKFSSKLILGTLSVFCSALSCTMADAAPMSVWHPSSSLIDDTRVTFWGHPYPYGYAWINRNDECVIRRRVETPQGWRWRSIWVCRDMIARKY